MADTGKIIALAKAIAGGGIDPATIEQSVANYLDAHPELVTTVQDGSITEAKLASTVLAKLNLVPSLSDEIDGIGSDVTDLNSVLNHTIDITKSKNLFDVSQLTLGKYLDSATGVLSDNSGRDVTGFIDVIPGKYLVFSVLDIVNHTRVANSAVSVCFYNESKTPISGGGTWKRSIIVPSTAKYARACVTSDVKNYEYQIELSDDTTFTEYEPYHDTIYELAPEILIPISQIDELPEKLDRLEENAENIDSLNSAVSDISESVVYDRYEVYTGPYYQNGVEPNGNPIVVDSWQHTEKIPVVPGENLIGETTDHTNTMGFKRLCAYYNDTIIPESGIASERSSYTVPEGVNYVVVTQGKAPDGKTASIVITGTDDMKKQVIPKSQIGYMRDSGDMQDGTILKVKENNVKNNVVVSFSGNITSFDKLYIGQRKSDNSGMRACYIEIDDTNIILHTDQGNATITHGLTIGSDIQVTICTGSTPETSLIRLASNGIEFNDTNPHRWLCDEGFASAVSVGSVLTDCALSWTSRSITNDIWVFGDSYVSLYNQRWVNWMIHDGFDKNCMINGFAGENSESAMIALENLLSVACPHYIVWCLGMNNGDSSSAVNASWLKNYKKMISYCKQNGITPILATIPNVPTVNNNFKNAIIRNSGYRYIDFSRALDPQENGTWIDGALSGDGVHPTEIGAKISWQRVLVDFPEIASY